MTHDEWMAQRTRVQARRYTTWLQRSEPSERQVLQGRHADFVVLDDPEEESPVHVPVLALVVLVILCGLASFWTGVGLAILIHGGF